MCRELVLTAIALGGCQANESLTTESGPRRSTSKALAVQELAPGPTGLPRYSGLLTGKRVTVDFVDTPALEALGEFAAKADVRFAIDGLARDVATHAGRGVTLRAVDKPAEWVLDRLLDAADLKHGSRHFSVIVAETAISVTTKHPRGLRSDRR